MPKRRLDLNAIYISERVQETLRQIARSALTAVVAPMGYGKTTAVNWFLAGRNAENKDACVVRVSIYSASLAAFWRSLQAAFAAAGLTVLDGYACPEDVSGAAMLLDDLCAALQAPPECYVFLDDFHLLHDDRVAGFLCALAARLPETAHLIVASRNRFVPGGQVVRLGRRLHRIEADQLRLNHTELAVYARRCGLDLTDQQVERLLQSSEGWFSAVYLNLHALAERGSLLGESSDIYALFTSAMIESLPARRREFLAVMGLADEFTVEMARAVTALPDAEQVLTALTEQNAFVTRLPGTERFRFHHMMKECAEKLFARLPTDQQNEYWERYGAWYARQRQYMDALNAYEACGDYDAALEIVEWDAGNLLASRQPDELMARLEKCPEEALLRHPVAILVLMRRMFTWRQIPKMMELKGLLEAAVAADPALSEAERGNLLGERDLILSFLMYNDITAMSRLHRSASAQMSRPAVTLHSGSSWTFGSPSVLMMYYRAPGELTREMNEMYSCMPYYCALTNGHGQGAEFVMDAEAAYTQGRFERAVLLLERARASVAASGQENMALCCDLLSLRLALAGQEQQPYDFAAKRAALLHRHDTVLLHLLESIEACYYALMGCPEQVPEVFREHKLASVAYYAPCRPMMQMIEQQVWLAQGQAVKVLARSDALLAEAEKAHYGLVALLVRIQQAAAFLQYGRRAEARACLARALQDAAPDGFWMLFAENYAHLAPLLEEDGWGDIQPMVETIRPVGRAFAARCAALRARSTRPAFAAALTDRELRMAEMVACRCTNKEIAQALYLSEGTVKQYINQLYAKLDIGGEVRTRRARLAELFRTKN